VEALEDEQLNTKYVYLDDRGGNFPRNAVTDLSSYTRLIPHVKDFRHTYIHTHTRVSHTWVCSIGNGY